MIDFSDWTVAEDFPYGSGASEKITLVNPSNQKVGIFKYPKSDLHKKNKITGEYWAESMAEDCAKNLGISCAHVDMGYFNGRIGSMSYLILDEENQELNEGIAFITKKFPSYSMDKFCDLDSGAPYSIEMIRASLEELQLENEFLKIPVLDYFIGNTDRHHSNWAIIRSANADGQAFKLSPVYDNGSSLCCYVNESDAENYLRDGTRYRAFAFGKSRSIIRLDIHKRPTHMDVMIYLTKNYHSHLISTIACLKAFSEEKISAMIGQYADEIIDPAIKKLLEKVLNDRRNRLIQLFDESR